MLNVSILKVALSNICLCLGMAFNAFAQGPPIITDSPILLGLDGSGIRTFARVVYRGTLRMDGSKINDPVDQRTRVFAMPFVLPYNLLSDKLQLRVIVPFLDIDTESQLANQSSTGIGDLDVSLKYEVFRRDARNQTFRIASRAGLIFPTGDEEKAPPLGRGTTNYYFTSVAGFIKKRVGLYAEGIYTVNRSSGGIDFGNAIGYNVAFGYRLSPKVYETYPSPQLNGFIEINGTTVNRDRSGGQRVASSGGTTILISPGLQYIGGRRWLIEASFQFPIVNEPNGTQLAIDWMASFGTRILLF